MEKTKNKLTLERIAKSPLKKFQEEIKEFNDLYTECFKDCGESPSLILEEVDESVN